MSEMRDSANSKWMWNSHRPPTSIEVPDDVSVDVTNRCGEVVREKGRYIRKAWRSTHPMSVMAWAPNREPWRDEPDATKLINMFGGEPLEEAGE